MAGSPDGGLINWLTYSVAGLFTFTLGLIQRHFMRRVSNAEETVDKLMREIKEERKRVDDKFEARRLETKEDFKLLHRKVEDGHREILKAIRDTDAKRGN